MPPFGLMTKSTDAESGRPPTRSRCGRPCGARLMGAGAAACGASIGRAAGETTPSRQPASAESKSSGPAMFHLLRRIATPACTGAREECPASDGHLVHLLLRHASRLRRLLSRSSTREGWVTTVYQYAPVSRSVNYCWHCQASI